MFDYKKLGLRAGLEIHQQLAAGHKLFCNCPIKKSESFPIEVKRKLRAVPSELGEYDIAAEYEYLRDRTFVYLPSPESSCLVELDEQPPKPINQNALRTSIQLAKLLHASIVDEIHVMRKTVIDGSAVSGFQRTALIATDGFIELSTGPLIIQTINLEEDSAPAVTKGDVIEYRLDRLGTPLVEIATDSTLNSPKEVREAAEKIGLLLRSLDVVRGIGSIRQDVNISIAEGARIEIKGFQQLDEMEKLVENEVARQVSLLEIRDELRDRNFKPSEKSMDVTEVFRDTGANIIKKALMENGRVAAAKLPKFSGLMKRQCGDRSFGKELSGYAGAFGLGIIHSDELEKFPFLSSEFAQLRKMLQASEEDLVFIAAGRGAAAAANAVVDRANFCIHGVPKETRTADGTGSKYARPLPGSGRLYPESDIPSIKLTKELLDVELPKTFEEKTSELKGIPPHLAEQIAKSQYYEQALALKEYDPVLAATIFLSTFKDLGRRRYDVSKVSKNDLIEIFKAVSEGKLPKNSMTPVLEEIIGGVPVGQVLAKYSAPSDEELKSAVRAALADNPEKSDSAIIGIVLSRTKGADGRKVAQFLKELR